MSSEPAYVGGAAALGLAAALAALLAADLPASAAAADPGRESRSSVLSAAGFAGEPTGAAQQSSRSERFQGLKAAVAAGGAALLAWGAWLRHRGRGASMGRSRKSVLAILGILGGLLWWNLGSFHTGGFYLHLHELYHYYVGAKYFPELGYERLYLCSVVADLEDGVAGDLRLRRMRDLETNQLGRASELIGDPERCTRHFAPNRWEAFKQDVRWFRTYPRAWGWRHAQVDHGYNPTPVWNLLGVPLANLAGPAERGVPLLALLDPLLLAGAFVAIAWSFGWQVLCVALVFFGTNQFARFGWTGGSFLRMDWLAALLTGVVLLHRGRPTAAGFLMTTSALLRLFPGVAVGAVALHALVEMVRRRSLRLSRVHLRYAAGCLLALALLLPLSVWTGGGLAVWTTFSENSRTLVGTPAFNHLGLRSVLAYREDTRFRPNEVRATSEDPYLRWRIGRRRAYEERRWAHLALAAVFAALLWRASIQQPTAVAAVLGIGGVAIVGNLGSYYYTMLMALAFLWPVHAGIGVALLAFAAVSRILEWGFEAPDAVSAWTSLALVGLAYASAWWAGSASTQRRSPEAPP